MSKQSQAKISELQLLNGNAVELVMREPGAHLTETVDGRLHYMTSGFIHIEIETNLAKRTSHFK